MIDFKVNTDLTKFFKKGINKDVIRQGLYETGVNIVNDAIRKPPTPRIDEGNLRGSFSISVGKKIMKKGKPKDVSKLLPPYVDGASDLELRVGFNVSYAKIMETGVRDEKEIGLGPKSKLAKPRAGNFFLSTKIKNKSRVYLKFLNGRINEKLL